MAIQYDTPTPGAITLVANYSSNTLVIAAGTDDATANADIVSFFAADTPPPTTKADVLAQLSQLTGFSVPDLTSFFAGTMI